MLLQKIELWNALLSLLLLLQITNVSSELRNCKVDETTYTYTECDVEEGRWRVQVPIDANKCQISEPEPPKRGHSCGFSCDAGHYLNLANQTCVSCPVGTYSLGSGVRFDTWDKLPDGFSTSAEAVTFTQYGYTSKVNNCSSSLWKPSEQYIVGNDDDCTSSLSFSVDLKQPGTVSFHYQYSDADIIFHFFVQNSQCQTSSDSRKNVFLNTTGTNWKLWTVNLEKGPNVLYWKTTGMLMGTKNKLNPVRIQDIEVTGVSYATQCHKCRPGYFASSVGSHWCNLCSVDTYSKSGAFMCSPCNSDTEFAPIASETCYKKPPCKEKDYFSTHTPCDENKMTRVTYKWIEPQICLDNIEGAVSLPPSGQKQECAPCNPGFFPTDASCLPCPPKSYSNGTHGCVQCPASTSPHYGLFYLWWDELPATMKSSCISLSRNDCDIKRGWDAVGDEVRTISADSGEAYLILVLNIAGYMEKVEEGVFGRLTFIFSLECEEDCQFYFMKDIRDKGTSVIQSWRGNEPKQTFSYDVAANDSSMSFTWAFQKGLPSDRARIFLVNATNVIGSSADSCVACAAGQTTGSKCIPCPTGSFLNKDTHKCKKCVGNTVLNSLKSGCVECGAGSKSTTDHLRCNNDCQFISSTTKRRYNFLQLSGTKSVPTLPTFTSTGRKYNHVYNISLCDNQGKGFAECIDNVTFAHSGLFGQESIKKKVGMACRSTSLPMYGSQNEHITVTSQPTLVASKLESVTQKPLSNGTNDDFVFPKDDSIDLNDVIFHMSASILDSEDCPNGRNTFIYLRCSPDISDDTGMIEMERKCPDGTCDGCNYYFLWRSLAACPLCTEKDYQKVVGACEHGKMATTYIWKRYPVKCRDGVTLPESTVSPCQDFTFYIELAVVGGVALLAFMCCLVCCLWKKSKKLEYKYQRLVVNEKCGMGESELAPVDTCAISDSDSDFDGQSDEVIFQKKKSRLFGKKKVNDYNSVSLLSASTGV